MRVPRGALREHRDPRRLEHGRRGHAPRRPQRRPRPAQSRRVARRALRYVFNKDTSVPPKNFRAGSIGTLMAVAIDDAMSCVDAHNAVRGAPKVADSRPGRRRPERRARARSTGWAASTPRRHTSRGRPATARRCRSTRCPTSRRRAPPEPRRVSRTRSSPPSRSQSSQPTSSKSHTIPRKACTPQNRCTPPSKPRSRRRRSSDPGFNRSVGSAVVLRAHAAVAHALAAAAEDVHAREPSTAAPDEGIRGAPAGGGGTGRGARPSRPGTPPPAGAPRMTEDVAVVEVEGFRGSRDARGAERRTGERGKRPFRSARRDARAPRASARTFRGRGDLAPRRGRGPKGPEGAGVLRGRRWLAPNSHKGTRSL